MLRGFTATPSRPRGACVDDASDGTRADEVRRRDAIASQALRAREGGRRGHPTGCGNGCSHRLSVQRNLTEGLEVHDFGRTVSRISPTRIVPTRIMPTRIVMLVVRVSACFVGSIGIAAGVVAPAHGDDVDAQSGRPRPKLRCERAQAAREPFELGRRDAPFGCRMIPASLDLDRDPAAAPAREHVDLAEAGAHVARDDPEAAAAELAAGEPFAGATRGRAVRLRVTWSVPARSRHARCARRRCGRTSC